MNLLGIAVICIFGCVAVLVDGKQIVVNDKILKFCNTEWKQIQQRRNLCRLFKELCKKESEICVKLRISQKEKKKLAAMETLIKMIKHYSQKKIDK